MKRFLLVMLFAGAAHAQLHWQACRSNRELRGDTAIIRFVSEPHPWGQYTPPIEAESSVALYLPKEGDAIVEFALVRPVVFKRSPIDRSLALALSRRLHEELQAQKQDEWTVVCMDSCADHTVVLRDDGETICRSATGDVSGADLDSTWTGRLAVLLRRTAETETPRAESEAALKELISLRVVVPRHVIGPSPNETP